MGYPPQPLEHPLHIRSQINCSGNDDTIEGSSRQVEIFAGLNEKRGIGIFFFR
jgi:hypothetical protein